MRKNLFVSMFVLLVVAVLGAERLRHWQPQPPPQTVVQVQTQIVQQVVTATPGPATATPLPAGSIQITAAGATFPAPLYSQWTYAYQYVNPAVVDQLQPVSAPALARPPSSPIPLISPVLTRP